MEHSLSEHDIVRNLAEQIGGRIRRGTIRQLQGMSDGLSGDNSGLNNVWDEICVQEQLEKSFSWPADEETMRTLIEHEVNSLMEFEREAIWLQTAEGDEWDCEDADTRDSAPVFSEDIVNHLLCQVLEVACNWSNKRIKNYMRAST